MQQIHPLLAAPASRYVRRSQAQDGSGNGRPRNATKEQLRVLVKYEAAAPTRTQGELVSVGLARYVLKRVTS